MKYRYLKESLWDGTETEDEIYLTHNELVEKYGITENIESLVKDINEIIINFIEASERAQTPKSLKRFFSYPNLRNNIQFINDDEIKISRLEFDIDPTKNRTSWMSNTSYVFVDIVEQKTDRKMNSKYPNGIFSDSSLLFNGLVEGIIYIYLQKEKNTLSTYKAGNYFIDIYDRNILASKIRHELNHIHKENEFVFDNKLSKEIFDDLYNKILALFRTNRGKISKLAYMIYRYCIGDERNAHIEQFYQEYKKPNFDTSEIWNDAQKDLKLINEYIEKIFDIDKKEKEIIYKNLFPICQKMFSINETNYHKFLKLLLRKIKMNIIKMVDGMKRAAKLYESDSTSKWYKLSRRY